MGAVVPAIRVQIDQSGQQIVLTQINDRGALRRFGPHRGDVLTVHGDVSGRQQAFAGEDTVRT